MLSLQPIPDDFIPRWRAALHTARQHLSGPVEFDALKSALVQHAPDLAAECKAMRTKTDYMLYVMLNMTSIRIHSVLDWGIAVAMTAHTEGPIYVPITTALYCFVERAHSAMAYSLGWCLLPTQRLVEVMEREVNKPESLRRLLPEHFARLPQEELARRIAAGEAPQAAESQRAAAEAPNAAAAETPNAAAAAATSHAVAKSSVARSKKSANGDDAFDIDAFIQQWGHTTVAVLTRLKTEHRHLETVSFAAFLQAFTETAPALASACAAMQTRQSGQLTLRLQTTVPLRSILDWGVAIAFAPVGNSIVAVSSPLSVMLNCFDTHLVGVAYTMWCRLLPTQTLLQIRDRMDAAMQKHFQHALPATTTDMVGEELARRKQASDAQSVKAAPAAAAAGVTAAAAAKTRYESPDEVRLRVAGVKRAAEDATVDAEGNARSPPQPLAAQTPVVASSTHTECAMCDKAVECLCIDCKTPFCDACFREFHDFTAMHRHARQAACSRACGAPASVQCTQCPGSVLYCADCFRKFHVNPKTITHAASPIA